MESSEDDAGTATNASRRASAREKDVGLAEDINATSSSQQKSSESRPSCETPAMSEDNYDGDSVPSPSAQDVNTSTEAILDMIDEIVEGPDAPKRLPLTSEPRKSTDTLYDELEISSVHSNIIQESTKSDHDNISPLPMVESPTDSVKNEPLLHPSIDSQAGSSFASDLLSAGIVNAVSVDSLPESDEPAVSAQPKDNAPSNMVPETPAGCPTPNIPSSSEEQTMQNISDVSECVTQERTVKCVSSSDSRDNVTVESAESTSSDSSVSESKSVLVEPQVRSPLRRRLIRPAPSDRRPDSTVSSTVDSQIVNILTTEQKSSENITKDVTSSSDAVPTIHGNVKPEEIRNVSEINFCKAETSISPKKIKLIRQKVITGTSNRDTSSNQSAILSDKDQCQSTSFDNLSLPLPEPRAESSSTVSISQSQDSNETSIPVSICVSEKPIKSPEHIVYSDEHSQPNIEHSYTPKREDGETHNNSEPVPHVQPSSCPPNSSELEANVNTSNTVQENSSMSIPNSDEPQAKIKVNDLEPGHTSHINYEDHKVTKDPENAQNLVLPLQESTNAGAPSISSSKDSEPNKSSEEDQKTVEPIKLNLSKSNLQKSISTSEKSEPDNTFQEEQVDQKKIPPVNLNLPLSNLQESTAACATNISTSKKPKPTNSSQKEHKYQKVPPVKVNVSVPNLQEKAAACSSSSLTSDKSEPGTSRQDQKKVPSIKLNLSVSNLPETTTDCASSISSSEKCEPDYRCQDQEDQKKVPPIKLNLSMSSLQESKTICASSISTSEKSLPDNSCQEDQKKVPPIKLNLSLSNLQERTAACASSTLISEKSELDNSSQEEQKKVPPIKLNLSMSNLQETKTETSENSEPDNICKEEQKDQKVPPIKLNLSMSNLPESKLEAEQSSISRNNVIHEEPDSQVTKQVPKLTIKLKQPDEIKSSGPKVTIKPIRPPVELDSDDKTDNIQQVPCVTKINIKPILKPPENAKEKSMRSQHTVDGDARLNISEQLPCITKLNIKPIPKPPEKINDIHRKSSSSEISESEYSENDETSTSDQASTSDQGPSEVVPKVTIKLGKPGTESEGKFYTEKTVPKVTIKGFQQDEKEEQESKLMVISQSEDKQPEKIPKLTIKTVSKSEIQPLSPKLTIKALKSPDTPNKDKISTESFSSSSEIKDSPHVPKITIKPVTRSTAMCDSPEHIPVVTKLNIKPVVKPTESGECSQGFDDKVPVVSKLNIKPVIKPKDNDIDCSVDDVPKITKLNIKPIKNPEKNSEEKDCDVLNADIDENSIPVVTKINIKPIIKPQDEETKDSENQSSETGNSSDDNGDNIPVVTKLNIKPIIKPENLEESSKTVSSSEQSVPVITKLHIKPLVKPGESMSPSSPKKEHFKTDGHSSIIPVVTKLNIKPVVRPEQAALSKSKDDTGEKSVVKNPPLVMKINMKTMVDNLNESLNNERVCNNVSDEITPMSPKLFKVANTLEAKLEACPDNKNIKRSCESVNDVLQEPVTDHSSEKKPQQNCMPDSMEKTEGDERTSVIKKPSLPPPVKEKHSTSDNITECDLLVARPVFPETIAEKEPKINEVHESPTSQEPNNFGTTNTITESNMMQTICRQKYSSVQNCTLLKKLLENTKSSISLDKSLEVSPVENCALPIEKNDKSIVNSEHSVESGNSSSDKINSGNLDTIKKRSSTPDKVNDSNKPSDSGKLHSKEEICDRANENITKPLEITISDKITNQSSGQDSPRIILKINKTDHGSSSKIITEDVKRPDTQQNYTENTQDVLNDKQSPKKHVVNSRRKQALDSSLNLSTGKRLRSSRIVENTQKTPIVRRNMGKRPSTTETSPPQNKESDLSLLQTKRLKLGQLLSNKSLSITPVSKPSPASPTKTNLDMKPGVKTVNHSLLNNENCSKNGNSKLHNILSNLQAKQMQSLPFSNTNCSEKAQSVATDIELNASVSSSDTVVTAHIENSHPELQEMIINENSDFRDLGTTPEEVSQDPLEVKPVEEPPEIIEIPKPVELTPQPKKRGRPRKLPVSEGAKPAVTLPVPALEERPQRSLRLMRDRPAILQKPRGRGRGRGGRRVEATPPTELETIVVIERADEPEDRPAPDEIDPTSSRIKLPRMTEALDNMPSSCITPLSSRRRISSGNFSTGETPELKVVLDSCKIEELTKTPDPSASGKGRGGRGSRGGRGRTPRGRGRGRGGGRGAMYMKETMGIYGRVCGPATTTVQLFEEETCMMDDNATPAKPSHLLDEDSQSSVRSSTNESNKLKKSKFADLFDSNKVWTAADVKEYTWPPDKADVEHKVMMIQEQVAMFLGVKSFKRRYAELKRRTITGEERDYVLSKGLVTEALCDLGITAVDASEVLDIMLSDYPHKYEEFRSHQRQRQLTVTTEEPAEEIKTEEKEIKVEMKPEKPVEHKPELPKIDPEKTRQDMAAAAIASASEWNARVNAARRGACADLQSMTVQRARAPPVAPAQPHLRPPAGFYPHALLPGQYQHCYRLYAPDQLRYFPLNTVLAAPPAPASEDWSSESEPDWGSRFSSSDDSDAPTHQSAKRKKLTKTKRSSHTEVASSIKEEPRVSEEVELCRVCKMRLEANRRYTHERFLVCAHCNAKLHPSCLELNADTIRKCREYAWQCAECKTCCSCHQPADDDKMLFCDLCDRGFHIYCVGLETVPSGRWHCVECAVCKSCGARSPSGQGGGQAGGQGAGQGSTSSASSGSAAPPADWHHQTRRGPGGHKVYSHSLCTPCARAYRIGRYCPLCERSFIGPKGTMQLVICKLCDRQLHQECVRQTVSCLNVLDYTCAECRRGGITSRAAAVRLAPRTIATLFMAKRRFNKYAHRQYLASRLREAEAEAAAADASCEAEAEAAPLLVDVQRAGGDASDVSEPDCDHSDPLDA